MSMYDVAERKEHVRRWQTWAWGVLVCATIVGLAACFGSTPIRHYQPAVLEQELNPPSSAASDTILAVEDFSANAAYDEQRIVYRNNEVQMNYYHYHRWAAPPGLLVSDSLRQIYRHTNQFRSVIGGYDSRADVVLGGRVIKFEEFDVSAENWKARVTLEIRLRDVETGELLWETQISKNVELDEQSPVGVARGVSYALTEIGRETAPVIVEYARRARQQQSTSPPSRSSSSSTSSASE